MPGFYWQRRYGGAPGQLRVVEVDASERDGARSLHVYVGGWEPGVPVDVRAFDGAEWAGPIPRPRDRRHTSPGSSR